MDSIEKLAQQFKKFPGVGSRQAKRFVYFLLSQNKTELYNIAKLVEGLSEDITECGDCHRFFKDNSNSKLCEVCASPNTDTGILMVVEKDVDFENIKKTNEYTGKFFILGGKIPILEADPSKKIRARALFDTAQKMAKGNLKEIIIALSVTPESENTTQYIIKILEPLSQKYSLKISTLGRGLSTGTELEYSDAETLGNALRNRN